MEKELLLCIVFLPFAGAFILPLLGLMSKPLRNYTALSFVLASTILSSLLIPDVIHGSTFTFAWQFPLGFNFILQADMLAVFMAIVSSFIGCIIVLYSFGYISHYENQGEYYLMVVLFIGSMMGIVYSANLIFLYLFWEVTAIACWRLIGFYREREIVIRANKAFLVTVFGALVMLIGFIGIYAQTGSFDMDTIRVASKNNPISNTLVLLILFGIFSKSATLPLHTWLPDAGVAPSPVTALLHAAVLVKIGVYVYARLFIDTFTIDPVWQTIVPVIAAISALVAAGAAMIETDMKRIIAYSTVSQIGFIFLGFAINNEMCIMGAMLYILMHGLAKGGLFLCAGIIEQNTNVKDITKLGGLIKTMPITAITFLFCAFSVMGIPPFGGFFSKYMVIAGAINGGQSAIAFVFIVGAFLTIIYLFRLFTLIFMGEMKTADAKEGSPVMITSIVILAGLSVISGILIYYPSEFVRLAVNQMLGMVQ